MQTVDTPLHAREWMVPAAGALLFLSFLVLPETASNIAWFFILLGLVFPGIPHGALDNYLLLQPLDSFYRQFLFYAFYLGIMAAVFILWMVSPMAGLLFFLIISAWHFGQTDNERFGIPSFWYHPITGSLVLGFILLSHMPETQLYFSLLDINSVFVDAQTAWILSAACLTILAIILLIKSDASRWALFLYLLTLLISSQLPLIPGFALYFVGIHSFSGWMAIHDGLKMAHSKMIRLATPFTLMAFVFIAGVIIFLSQASYHPEQMTAWFFIALSCISAPHIVMMHLFYHQR
jgi:Brp/Blh family beta-carotene 15,15'-monooxygenase